MYATRTTILVLSILDLFVYIIQLALAAENKRRSPSTNNLIAAFGLLAGILGILLSIAMITMAARMHWEKRALAAWMLFAGICCFFTAGALGMWSNFFYSFGGTAPFPSIWITELAFEIIAVLLLIILMATVVAALKSRLRTTPK